MSQLMTRQQVRRKVRALIVECIDDATESDIVDALDYVDRFELDLIDVGLIVTDVEHEFGLDAVPNDEIMTFRTLDLLVDLVMEKSDLVESVVQGG